MDRKQNILFFVLPLLAPQETLGCIFVPSPSNPPATTTTEAPTTTAPTPAPTTTASTTGSGVSVSSGTIANTKTLPPPTQPGPCLVVDGPGTGKPCVFPF